MFRIESKKTQSSIGAPKDGEMAFEFVVAGETVELG